MGGRGSGNFYRWSTKTTTGECRSIDVRHLARDGLLAPGWFGLSWRNDEREVASIGVSVPTRSDPPAEVFLDYRSSSGGGPWRDIRERVGLDWTPCRYGGARPWFVCPTCLRRVALLYLGNPYWACRRCLDLVYQSTREGEAARLRDRAQRLVRRLGGGPRDDAYDVTRPKGMHWTTYRRLKAEALAAEQAYDRAFWLRMAQLAGVSASDPLSVSQAIDELLG